MKNNNDDKEYISFGGDNLYINFDSILDLIRVDNPIIDYPTTPQNTIKNDDEFSNDTINNADEHLMNVSTFELSNLDDEIKIDMSKYEVLKMLLDHLLHHPLDIDTKMGFASLKNNAPLSLILSYNTLLKYNIIEKENN